MSQEGGLPAGKNRRHPSSMDIDLTATNRIYAVPNRIQPASIYPVLNGPPTQPQPQELLPPYHPILFSRQRPNCPRGRLLS